MKKKSKSCVGNTTDASFQKLHRPSEVFIYRQSPCMQSLNEIQSVGFNHGRPNVGRQKKLFSAPRKVVCYFFWCMQSKCRHFLLTVQEIGYHRAKGKKLKKIEIYPNNTTLLITTEYPWKHNTA